MLRMPQLQAMQWDFKDQLRLSQRQAVNAADLEGAQRQGERTYYVYDSAGQRVRKVTEVASGQIRDERIYLAGFEIYRRYGAASLIRTTLHVTDNKQRIALVETRTQGNDGSPAQLIRYQFGNHLGSSNLELDPQAQILSYEEYYPYGSVSYQSVRNQNEVAKRYSYSGKERDEESGLYYYGARYYAPWISIWTSCDPLVSKRRDDSESTDKSRALSVSPYQFNLGNPISFIDPDGWIAAPVVVAAIILVGLGIHGDDPGPVRWLEKPDSSLTDDAKNEWYLNTKSTLDQASAPFDRVSPHNLAKWILFEWPTYSSDIGSDLAEWWTGPEPSFWVGVGSLITRGKFQTEVEGLGITNLRESQLVKDTKAFDLLQTTPGVPPEIARLAKISSQSREEARRLLYNDDVFSIYVLAAVMQQIHKVLTDVENSDPVLYADLIDASDRANARTGGLLFTNEEERKTYLTFWAIEKNVGKIDQVPKLIREIDKSLRAGGSASINISKFDRRIDRFDENFGRYY
jgi:RHS repeat-associated protein